MRHLLRLVVFSTLVSLLGVTTVESAPGETQTSAGSLSIMGPKGSTAFCPLRHTDVKAGLSGFVARVVVTQQFENPSPRAIEAVYTFPLPHEAAVDDMTIRIGSRTIRGVIKQRDEAAKIYQKAIQQGKVAALLDQERPNIFTQAVGNIPPGETVEVSISYVEQLKFEEGSYEFVFPMVVGPRYIPGNMAIPQTGGGFSPDTDRVPDASKITPPVSPTRTGHDISISLALDAGVAIQDLRSPTHKVNVQRVGANQATVTLADEATIPNKDFILRYAVAGDQIVEGLLTHTRGGEGYFSLMIQPPARFKESDVTSKEIVFVLDSSGSMGGFPLDKAKRFIDTALGGLYPGDTFNVIKFSGETAILFPEPVYASATNLAKAKGFVDANYGGGGTEMMKAIRAALDPSDSQDHLRIVVFLTDGYVGNDFEIISEVKKHTNARVFAYGIGSSVNRFLLTKMAEEGRGEVEIISSDVNPQEADEAADRMYSHLRAPLLTDISLDFGKLAVSDVYPTRLTDLYAGKPVIVTGRYQGAATGVVHLRAKRVGQPYEKEVSVNFPVESASNSVLPNIWARARISDLMSKDWKGLQQQAMSPELEKEITQLGLKYGLMTQFTSFVAVEERVTNVDGKPTRVQVPVELPEGVQYEKQWGDRDALSIHGQLNSPMLSKAQSVVVTNGVAKMAPPPPPMRAKTGSGVGGGVGVGTAGGIVGGIYQTNDKVARAKHEAEPPRSDAYKAIAGKARPEVLAAYECWEKQKDEKRIPGSSCKPADGILKIEVLFSGEQKLTLSQLIAVGFEPDTTQPGRNRLHGKIAIDKLPALAALKQIQLIALRK